MRISWFASLCLLTPALLAQPAPATVPGVKLLFDLSAKGAADADSRLVPSSAQVTFARSQDPNAPGLTVTIQPGKEGYPGINLKPPGNVWDLSAYGRVEARVVNTGAKAVSVSLRVDNNGDWQAGPWNTESAFIKPGTTGTVTVIFGFSYGRKPGYALNPAAVVNFLLFATKSDAVQSFRLESLVATGSAGEKPPVDPNSIRTKPKDGILFGAGVVLDAAKQLSAQGAQASVITEGQRPIIKVVCPAGQANASAALKPAVGRWDLRDALEVRVKLRNGGARPVLPRLRVESNGGPSDWASAAAPLAPGTVQELAVSFLSASIWNGKPNTGSRVTHDAVSAITIGVEKADGESVLLVESIQAVLPPAPAMPDWLGKRPPVPGDWVKTFDEDFTGNTVDASRWRVYAENYWDKTSHFSKDNVIVGGGVARLRYEKKRGHHNDDPKLKESNYASGILDTYGKWTQCYGYFEARMKLPAAPGLWPAFWMMPDRGASADPQWKRQDTGNGGMEFDIMENLTRWGASRYNIAMHWDGYGKTHKSIGTDKIYVQPDRDGYITTGLLWTPGSAVYYGNGREVARWDDPRVSNVPAILMFTLPMGGWDNNALDDAQLPADFIIDYVRVWQRKDLAK
ncbi:MAG: glycoside hydrolase family 16 protein [Verrucomicrobiota bacterium]